MAARRRIVRWPTGKSVTEGRQRGFSRRYDATEYGLMIYEQLEVLSEAVCLTQTGLRKTGREPWHFGGLPEPYIYDYPNQTR